MDRDVAEFSRSRMADQFRTGWVFDVDLDRRGLLRSLLPDLTLHFSVPMAATRLRAAIPRLTDCEAPVAIYGHPPPPPVVDLLAEFGVPVACLSPLPFLTLPAPRHRLPLAGGYLLRTPEELEGECSPLSATAPPDADALARYRQARALFDGPEAPVPESGDGRRRAALIADDRPPDPEHAEAVRAGYIALAELARELCQGWDITFFPNGDGDLPEETARRIRSLVTRVAGGRASPGRLEPFAMVLAHASIAAVDAALAGKRLVLSPQSPFSAFRTIPGALPAAFARMLETDAFFVDPVDERPADLASAARAVADHQRALDGSPAALRVAELWNRLPAVPTSEQEPPAEPPADWTLVPPRPGPPGGGPGSLALPHWISSDPLRATAPVPTLVVLAPDFERSPEAPPLPLEIVELDTAASDPGSPHRVRSFAYAQPEAVSRVLMWKLASARSRHALIIDLEDPATRLFARACRRQGIICVHLPATAAGPEEDPARVPFVRYSALVDALIAWDESHLAAARAAAFPADRILTAHRQAPATCRAERGTELLAHLDVPWPPAPSGPSELVTGLADAARNAGLSFTLHAQPEVYAALSERTLASLARSPAACLEIPPFLDETLESRLARRPVLVTQDPALAARTRRAGGRVLLCPATDATGAGVAAPTGPGLLQHLVALLAAPALPPAQPLTTAPPLDTVLATLPARAPASRGDALQMVMANAGDRLNLVASPVSVEAFLRVRRHEVAMLHADAWIPATSGVTFADLADVDLFVQWGLRSTSLRALAASHARRLGRPLLYLEDGFIRSVDLGLTGAPTLSIVMDDLTPFYDATRPSRLETLLNGDRELTDSERARARAAIDDISRSKILKYNFAPYEPLAASPSGRPRILVVDQRAGDLSIERGLAGPDSFRDMIEAALALSDRYDILVKTHPDANSGEKTSAIPADLLDMLATHPRVTLVTHDINAHSLIDGVEKVFVVTSGLGFESLMAGREVWCFGVPFYSGWGLTRDMVPLPRRQRRRRIEDVFFVVYILLSRYFHPEWNRVCEVEDIIAYVREARPWPLEIPADVAPAI